MRLTAEQPNVRNVAKETKPTIKSLRNFQRTLATQKNNLRKVDLRMMDIVGWDTRQHLQIAAEQLQMCIDKLMQSEQLAISSLHPATKLPPGYKGSPWKVLIKDFNYDLVTLRLHAPRQWLIEALDAELESTFKMAKVKISAATRQRIIAAIFSATDLEPIDPLTLKEYFIDKKKKKLSM